MQKIWPLEVFGLIVPKKKSPNIFSIYVKQWKSFNEQLRTDTCHKSTLSPNNFMFKLIMFVEKTKHLYSRVEIKTLKQGKTMFDYQTLKIC
jgi:hypothetical protein